MQYDSRKRDRRNFGNGQVGGDRNWHPPVHGTTASGRKVTFSEGRGPRDGETLISRGHVGMDRFYGKSGDKGHDHFGKNGEPHADRGKY